MAKKSNNNLGCLTIIFQFIYELFSVLYKTIAVGFDQKKENDLKRELEERKSMFLNSQEYQLVEQFSKKFKNQYSSNDLDKLNALLKQNSWVFESKQLEWLISEENENQVNTILKARILSFNPRSEDEYIRAYLEVCGNNTNKIELLEELLLINNISPKIDSKLLQGQLSLMNNKLEIELFEKRLLGADRQLTLEDIDQIDGYDFERFLKELFFKMGYQVEQTRLSGDQGADVVISKFGEKTVIQAKRYSSSVGNWAVQEIMAAISLYKAQKGMVITNNYFTKQAIELAMANNIKLVNRDGLKELIEKYW